MQSEGASLRVLAVDDDPAEFALLEDGFAHCGAEVELLTATTAPLALAELALGGPEGRPHIALIDINMPLVSGFELAEELIRQDVPTILMSSQVDGERSARAQGLGAIGLFAKPTDAKGYVTFAAQVLNAVRPDSSAS
jgi:CheY-like chemotaxis protein